MKILVLYQIDYFDVRNTINEHLFAFKNYDKKVQFHYFNIFNSIPKFLSKIRYDGIILHYTFLANRFSDNNETWEGLIKNVKFLRGFKVAIPQDEYDKTYKLCNLFKEHGIKTVFTCFERQEDYLKAYPFEKTGLENYIPVLTGYVDEKRITELANKLIPFEERRIDIGYRARKLPYYFGKHGQLKYELTNVFNSFLQNSKLKTDILNTDESKTTTFYGNDWYSFLINCKSFIGCEGGSSLLDWDGNVKIKVLEYIKQKPLATFEETEENCFSSKDYNIRCFAISPRHFEAAITKTLQILVEGNYARIFKPGIHYIELKRDFKNIEEVIDKLADVNYCKKIIDNTYNDIVLSGKYSYSKFVELVLDHIKEQTIIDNNSLLNNLLFNLISIVNSIRNFIISIFMKIYSLFYETNFYYKLKNNPKLFKAIKKLLPF